MSKEIWEFSAIEAGNQFAPADGGWVENMSRRQVNDAARQNLATLRRHYNDSEFIRPRIQGPNPADAGVFARTGANECTITLAATDLSGYFGAGRIVKIKDGGGVGVDLITQCAANANYAAGVTTITTKATINVAATDIYTHSSSLLRAQGLLDDNSVFFIPTTNDSAGIQAAVDAASAAGGGTVFLNASSYTIATQITIDGSKGNIIIRGRGPQTTLLRTAAIDSIIHFNNAAKSLVVRDLKFDVDRPSNPGGNGYALSVQACLSLEVSGCEFERAATGIRFTGPIYFRVRIRDCYFRFYQYGVSTTAVGDFHEGLIDGCIFDGSLMSLASPACVRLSGAWTVNACAFRSVSHGSLNPVGIYIWDKSSALNGGWRSVVTNNQLTGSSTTGTFIWMGADDGVCVGNIIFGAGSTVGIKIGSQTAGQHAERVTCQGNTVSACQTAIQATEFMRHCNILGNTLAPSATGISLGGDQSTIASNFIRACPVGIDVLTTALNNLISANELGDMTSDAIIVRSGSSKNVLRGNFIYGTPTRGINVEATAVDTLVADNYAPDIAIPLTNLSTTTRFTRNLQQKLTAYSEIADDASIPNTETLELTIDLPGGGGIGDYIVQYYFWGYASATSVDLRIRFRVGTAGNLTDPSVFTLTENVNTTGEEISYHTDPLCEFSVTDALVNKLTVSYEETSAGGPPNVSDAWIMVTKVSEPLG